MAQDMEQHMFFAIGAPRSGTTMLMRMLHAHPDIYTRPEPHLLTPLSRLGYFGYVDKAPYDHFQAHESAKQWVADLPGGEQDYVDALRAYTDALYHKLLEPSGKRYFVDKTPAYALELPFIKRIYPNARYVVITRHPFAIFSSFAKSFFDNDWEAAHAFNPILERYVPAIASFVRKYDQTNDICHVRYEELVQDPEAQCKRICAHASMDFTDDMIHYGKKKMEVQGLGDPIGVDKHNKPNTSSIDKWAEEVVGRPERQALLQQMLQPLQDEDLAVFGVSRDSIWNALEAASAKEGAAAKRQTKKWDRYHLQRRALLLLRRNIHDNALGRILTKVRFTCDVLLRE